MKKAERERAGGESFDARAHDGTLNRAPPTTQHAALRKSRPRCRRRRQQPESRLGTQRERPAVWKIIGTPPCGFWKNLADSPVYVEGLGPQQG